MEKQIGKESKNYWIKNVADFIGMDTSGRNETKDITVVIRVLIISCILYFTVNMILCNVLIENINSLIFYGVFLLSFLGIFTMSYHFETSTTLWCFNVGMIVWIVGIVHFFGWNIGVQHFLMLLLVLYFFSSYKHYVSKMIFAAGMCVFRILLFYMYSKRTPDWQLTNTEETVLQILNTITIFWCISIISYICSKNSKELEGKLVEYNNQLEKQANTDTLTGLFNRRKALEYMNSIIETSGYEDGFSLCICDIDFFKKVNDNYGHDFGDEVLKKISDILQEETKGKDFAARWGGEEFLLVFPDCNGDEAYVKLEKIRRKIKEMRVPKENIEVGVTMTFGLAEYDFYHGLDATIKEADEKLYRGKERGRDIIIF